MGRQKLQMAVAIQEVSNGLMHSGKSGTAGGITGRGELLTTLGRESRWETRQRPRQHKTHGTGKTHGPGGSNLPAGDLQPGGSSHP